MKLPNAERAAVEPIKVRAHLLAPEHPLGGAKARFFAALGFARDGWPLPRDALPAVARGDGGKRERRPCSGRRTS